MRETGQPKVNLDELGHDYDPSNDLGDSWRLISTRERERGQYPPPKHGYLEGEGRLIAIGATSSHCEVCGDEVDGWSLESHAMRRLYPNDFRIQNATIMCRDCYDFTPNWREIVLDRRPDRSPAERVRHWLRDPHARLLFWRRIGVALGIAALIVSFLPISIALVTGLFGGGNGIGIGAAAGLVWGALTTDLGRAPMGRPRRCRPRTWRVLAAYP